MTSQEKKAWLRRYTDLNGAINQKINEIDTCRALCEKMVAVMSDMPRGGGCQKEDTYIRLITLIDEVNAEVDAYVDMRTEIANAIRTVPGIVLQTLLNLRYIDGKTWEQVAVDMGYAYRHVTRMHGEALNILEIANDVLVCPI